MTILQSIILGIVEGLSEFLPISSTAHLIITSALLKIPETDFLKTFLISIQLGAILSVAVLYFKKVVRNPKIILKIIAATIPTAIIGLLAYSFIKNYLMESLSIIASALILGGVVLIILENKFKRDKAKKSELKIVEEDDLGSISYKQSFLIGLFQSLAIVPGVSRSAATIMGGLSLGISRKNIVEFSFLIALPTMLGATVLDLYKSPPAIGQSELFIWLIGFFVSFVTAIFGIKFFLKFIQKNNFIPFAWYRIALGSLVLIALFLF